jgi:hypothetical protein
VPDGVCSPGLALENLALNGHVREAEHGFRLSVRGEQTYCYLAWQAQIDPEIRSDERISTLGPGKALLSKRVFFRGLPILFRHFLRASLPHDGHSAGRVLDFALLLQIL